MKGLKLNKLSRSQRRELKADSDPATLVLSKHNAEKVLQAREKKQRVIELRAQGMKFADIAKEVGYANASGASQAYDDAIRQPIAGALEEQALALAQIDAATRADDEITRLLADGVIRILKDQRYKSDESRHAAAHKGFDSLVKMRATAMARAARRARLTGIDAPTKSSSSTEVIHKLDGELIRSNLITALDAIVCQVKDEEIVAEVIETTMLPALPEGAVPTEAVVETEPAASEASDPLPEYVAAAEQVEEPQIGEG